MFGIYYFCIYIRGSKGKWNNPHHCDSFRIKFQSKPQNYLYIQKLTYNEVYIYMNCLITTKVHPNVSSASKHLIQPLYLRLICIVQTCAAKKTSLYLMLKKFCLHFVEDIWYQKFLFFFLYLITLLLFRLDGIVQNSSK